MQHSSVMVAGLPLIPISLNCAVIFPPDWSGKCIFLTGAMAHAHRRGYSMVHCVSYADVDGHSLQGYRDSRPKSGASKGTGGASKAGRPVDR